MTAYAIALIGNPNSGKTSLFNRLTGARQRTGNWPGVTVERKEGDYRFCGVDFRVVDLPGTYSLDPEETSPDERIARDFILSRQADVLVNIVDASQLERALYLTLQLAETGVPQVLALNMMDLAERRGIEVDAAELSRLLGTPGVPIIARDGTGLEDLKAAIAQQAREPAPPRIRVTYPAALEQAIARLTPSLARFAPARSERWQALHLLAGHPASEPLPETLAAQVKEWRTRLQAELGPDLDLVIADARYRQAHELARQVTRRRTTGARSLSDRIDAVVLNRWLGVPVFLLAMYALFTFTINIGGAFVDFFDQAAGALFVDGLKQLLAGWGAPAWLQVLLADGIGGGIQVVATFVPIIGFLYLFLTLLEDSGYMARAAFVMDRLMQKLGLPGKAFVPLIVGFGCNVPAIMAARTLERERERILTVMMAPFMSCGARLAVYALFAAAFFPQGGQNVVFLLYLVGILAAMGTACLLNTTLLPGEPEPLLLELPAYQLPSGRNLLLHSWLRLKGFVTDAGKYIVVMVMVVNFLNAWGTDGRFGDVAPHRSMLAATAQAVTPALRPLGIEADNWPATVGILTGILAKEVVVGTLDTLYSRLDETAAAPETDAPFDLKAELAAAIATIPANLRDSLNALGDPLGLRVLESSSDLEQAAAVQEVHRSTFGTMVRHFDSRIGAFAYLLFILLYSPCVAATAAIRRETGSRWMLFALGWTTGLAYGVATFFYQAATLPRHPMSSLIWMAAVTAALALFWLGLRLRRQPPPPLAPSGGGPGLIHRSCCR
ncbi:ferrous iron transport protein B [Methylomarinovum caldicuralii]|uniref:Ferrous iron transport protein B n=1 Tax=Methylomarinovum caldicuralii TaxID=438856 RepID=A0AAU9CWS0_9GAMM|nr:Fe(2+) transporter permease subunit FeoB [Methylomarinovum caldicuralii]BCX82432.1 ferrous iron transport protein B [Methylomarinovum caldicuralii]